MANSDSVQDTRHKSAVHAPRRTTRIFNETFSPLEAQTDSAAGLSLPGHAQLRPRRAERRFDGGAADGAHRVDVDAAAAEEAASDAERLGRAALLQSERDALDGVLVEADLGARHGRCG